MPTYHVEHRHSYENCYGPPDFNEEKMDLWRQVKVNAEENNVEIKFFKMNPSQHVSFMLLEAPDYESLEKNDRPMQKNRSVHNNTSGRTVFLLVNLQ